MAAQISLVVASGVNGQIGLNNGLPWDIPDELKHFKELTLGQAVIQGRKTFESIGRPLPNRQNIVVSSKLHYLPGVQIASSLKEAIDRVEPGRIAYVIGGVSLWKEALLIADSAVITLVQYDGEADVHLPADFFDFLRENYRLFQMKAKHGYSLTEWIRSRK